MHIPENGADLVQSTIVLDPDAALLLGDQPCTLLEILLILKVTKVGLVHLSGHLLEVLEDAYLILLSLLAQEGLIVILVVDQPMLSGVLSVDRYWVTPEEDLALMKFLEHFIMLLKLLRHLLNPFSL